MLGNPGRAVDVGTKCIVSKQTLPLEKVYLTRVANCLFIGYLISWFDMANKINLSPAPHPPVVLVDVRSKAVFLLI